MYTMTYDSLLTDVRAYLERGFTSASDPQVFAQLPNLVTLAERTVARELKILGFVEAVSTTINANVPILTKPDRWRDTISMRISTGLLQSRSYEYCRNYCPDETETGVPEFYADYDYEHWLFVPTPATDTTLEILYYEQPPFLDASNQTNWLTDYAPDVLLYATLLQAMPFLKDDERIPTWKTMYQEAVAKLGGEDLKRIADRTSSRTET